jgi:hypothetical protein
MCYSNKVDYKGSNGGKWLKNKKYMDEIKEKVNNKIYIVL